MKRTSWDRLQGQYHLIRDCLDGEDAVKDQGQLYVPKPDGMSAQNYTHYLDRACFYGAPEMTLRALVGLALRKDPVVKLPPRLEPMRLNATYENAPMQVLVEDMVREVATMGRFGTLNDMVAEGGDNLFDVLTPMMQLLRDQNKSYENLLKVYSNLRDKTTIVLGLNEHPDVQKLMDVLWVVFHAHPEAFETFRQAVTDRRIPLNVE